MDYSRRPRQQSSRRHQRVSVVIISPSGQLQIKRLRVNPPRSAAPGVSLPYGCSITGRQSSGVSSSAAKMIPGPIPRRGAAILLNPRRPCVPLVNFFNLSSAGRATRVVCFPGALSEPARDASIDNGRCVPGEMRWLALLDEKTPPPPLSAHLLCIVSLLCLLSLSLSSLCLLCLLLAFGLFLCSEL